MRSLHGKGFIGVSRDLLECTRTVLTSHSSAGTDEIYEIRYTWRLKERYFQNTNLWYSKYRFIILSDNYNVSLCAVTPLRVGSRMIGQR
jgi:hypothetical protein